MPAPFSTDSQALVHDCTSPCTPTHARACQCPLPHMPVPSSTPSLPLPFLCPHPQLFHADHHLIYASHHPLVYLVIVPSNFSPHWSLLFSHHQHAHPQICVRYVRWGVISLSSLCQSHFGIGLTGTVSI